MKNLMLEILATRATLPVYACQCLMVNSLSYTFERRHHKTPLTMVNGHTGPSLRHKGTAVVRGLLWGAGEQEILEAARLSLKR